MLQYISHTYTHYVYQNWRGNAIVTNHLYIFIHIIMLCIEWAWS